MAVCKVDSCCMVMRGKILLGKYDPCCGITEGSTVIDYDKYPLTEIGNAYNFEITETTSTIEPQKNYMSADSVSDCPTITQVDKIEIKATVTCSKIENIAMALSGDINDVASATGVAQTFKFTVAGQFIPFRNADGEPVANVDVASVTGLSALVEGTDYTVSSNGITLLSTTTQTLPLTIASTYDHGAYSEVQRLTELGGEYQLFFDGVNIANGQPIKQHFYRVKLNPGGLKNMLADNYMEWEMTGSVLPDKCHSKEGQSKYGTYSMT